MIGRLRRRTRENTTTNNTTTVEYDFNKILDDKNLLTFDENTQTIMVNGKKYLTGITNLHPIIFTLYAHDFSFSEDNMFTVVHYDSNINVYSILKNKVCSFFQTIMRNNVLYECNVLVRYGNKQETNENPEFSLRIMIPGKPFLKEMKIKLTPSLEYTNKFNLLPFSFDLSNVNELTRSNVDIRVELSCTEPFELHSATCFQYNDMNDKISKNNAYSSLLSRIDVLRNTVRNIESVINCTLKS